MEQPSTTDLRSNFQEQLKSVTEKVNALAAELKQAEEFRLKLIGGLETLQILDPVEESVQVEEESSDSSEDS
jgi:hypothetical protein